MRPHLFLALALAALAVLAGCGSATTTTPAPGEKLPPLRPGMPAEEITRQLGKPATVLPITLADGSPAEVWEYRFPVKSNTTMMATGMTDAPAFDPLLRDGVGVKTVREMSYQTKTEVIVKVVALQIKDGALLAARTGYEQQQDFK